MNLGDLLLVKPGTNVGPGTRYSSGIILAIREFPQFTRDDFDIYLNVLWSDGHKSEVDQRKIIPYYEVVGNEAR